MNLSRSRCFVFYRSDGLSRYGLDVGLRVGRPLPRWDFGGGFSSRCGRSSGSWYLVLSLLSFSGALNLSIGIGYGDHDHSGINRSLSGWVLSNG